MLCREFGLGVPKEAVAIDRTRSTRWWSRIVSFSVLVLLLAVSGAAGVLAETAAAAQGPQPPAPALHATQAVLSPEGDGSVASVLASAVQVAAGGDHTCALTAAGRAKCWGRNDNGQLGDGTTTERSAPVDVAGLASGVAVVAAGGYHTCVLTAQRGVKCWGWNEWGMLGDGTTTRRSIPVDVVELASGVISVTAGGLLTCALMDAGHGGGVKCWGADFGPTPVDVAGLQNGVAAVTAGGNHACALTAGGGVRCWGWNGSGQLGDGTRTSRSTPADVAGLASGVAAVVAGMDHTCALMDAVHSGAVKCWGANYFGQLGDGSTMDRTTPVDVTGLAGSAAAIGAGGWHTCVLIDAAHGGGIVCWGRNGAGQLGDGTTTGRGAPADVAGLASNVAAVAAGGEHTCALMDAVHGGAVLCWGLNWHGQLGDGTTRYFSTTPVGVVGFEDQALYAIIGRVTDGSGQPVGGVVISDGAVHTATTSASGSYTLDGLPAGTYSVTADKSGYAFTPASRSSTVPPSATGQDFVGSIATPTPTATVTTSATPTDTATSTPTETPAASPTNSATVTLTPAETPTPTATATATASPEETNTPTPTLTSKAGLHVWLPLVLAQPRGP